MPIKKVNILTKYLDFANIYLTKLAKILLKQITLIVILLSLILYHQNFFYNAFDQQIQLGLYSKIIIARVRYKFHK